MKALKNLPDQKISEAIHKCEVCCQAKSKKKEKGKKSEVNQEIQTDNASEYTSAKFKAWCKEKRINHQTSAPYKQNQNGVTENAVHQLKTMA